MNDHKLKNLDQVRAFLIGTTRVNFNPTCKSECYEWIQAALTRFTYHQLGKKDKGDVRRYLQKVTGYSRQQITRLIEQHRETRRVTLAPYDRDKFPKIYTREDIRLLAEVDELHQIRSGAATKKTFERMFTIYQDDRYERLSKISVAHIYNLRKTHLYRERYQVYTKTKSIKSLIGERRKPIPDGCPGFLRVDSVHQGDQDKVKGVYHINLVDAVTQWEIVCTVEVISEYHLIPALEKALEAFPFVIKGFHSDNGSEYINATTAKLLNKLLIEFTKSRARQTTDNALVEGKNAAVVRKFLGYVHIPKRYASLINAFNDKHLNPYVNYHRPCFFAEIKMDEKGKERKRYLYKNMMTPYDKLKSLPDAAQYLKQGVTFERLDQIAMRFTDNEAAKHLKQARYQLFNTIFEQENLISMGKVKSG